MFPKNPSLAVSAAVGACLLLPGLDAAAQTTMPARTNWVVGSDELIRIALTNNLSIQISQIQPQLDQLALDGVYGAYDPSNTLSVTHNYNASPPGAFAQNGYTNIGYTSQIN